MPERSDVAMVRLLSLVSWIGQHPGETVDRAARHFGRSRTQILRDIELLGEVNDSMPGDSFEVDWDLFTDEDRLSLHTTMGVDLPPRLTPDEATAVLIGLQAIAPVLDDDLRAHLPHTALAVAALSPGTGDVAREVVVSAPPVHDPRLDVLNGAMREGRRVDFGYTTVDGRTGRREVDPWELRQDTQGWMLRGWCHTASGERNFRLSRMEDLTVADRPADHPRPSAPAPGQNSDGFPRALLTLSDAARWVAEEVPGEVIAEGPDRFTLEIQVWDVEWVEALLIDVAPHLVDVDPPELASSMSRRARAALGVWRSAAGSAQ